MLFLPALSFSLSLMSGWFRCWFMCYLIYSSHSIQAFQVQKRWPGWGGICSISSWPKTVQCTLIYRKLAYSMMTRSSQLFELCFCWYLWNYRLNSFQVVSMYMKVEISPQLSTIPPLSNYHLTKLSNGIEIFYSKTISVRRERTYVLFTNMIHF